MKADIGISTTADGRHILVRSPYEGPPAACHPASRGGREEWLYHRRCGNLAADVRGRRK